MFTTFHVPTILNMRYKSLVRLIKLHESPFVFGHNSGSPPFHDFVDCCHSPRHYRSWEGRLSLLPIFKVSPSFILEIFWGHFEQETLRIPTHIFHFGETKIQPMESCK